MFTHILFLILALLLINTVPEEITPWINSPALAFLTSLLLYIGLCGLICLEYVFLKGLFRKLQNFISIIVNLQLLLYLIIYQYILDAGRIFRMIPHMQNLQTLNTTWELILYLGGLCVYYCASYVRYYSSQASETRLSYALRQIRLLLPFAIPFIILTFSLDIFDNLMGANSSNNEAIEWISIILSFVLMISLLLFLPYFIQKIWQCKTLGEGELKNRLAKVCELAGFRHAGLKTWTIMNDQLTAGIIGIIPRFRYVMFTERLLAELPPESIEAILAHEIGHNKRRHLLLYPFILSGMMICAALFFYFFSEPLLNILEKQNALHPSKWWDLFNPLLIFSIYAIIIICYFRFVFGYFSRLFERQADLHIFELGIAPQHMIHALKMVAYACGGYETPNWHHYSVKQRVEFLEACIENPKKIQHHHRKVKIILGFFFVLLIAFGSLLIKMV